MLIFYDVQVIDEDELLHTMRCETFAVYAAGDNLISSERGIGR